MKRSVVCGIDIGKEKHHATVIMHHPRDGGGGGGHGKKGGVVHKGFFFENNAEGFNKLRENLPPGSLIGMEATGHYWKPVHAWFSALKTYTIKVLNPFKKEKRLREGLFKAKETDKNDSHVICILTHERAEEDYDEEEVEEEEEMVMRQWRGEKKDDLKELTRFRNRLVKELTMKKNEETMAVLLDLVFPELQRICSGGNVFTKSIVDLLTAYTVQEIGETSTPEQLEPFINLRMRGKIPMIIEAARNTIGMKDDPLKTVKLRILLRQIRTLSEDIKTVEKEVKKLLGREGELLRTIPGISDVTAGVILGEIGDIKAFKTPEKLASYAGVTPRVIQSGRKDGRGGGMDKRGNPHLRAALWQAALTMVQKEGNIREYYLKKIREGKKRKVALGAVTRKLVHIIHSILIKNRPYKETKT